MSRKVLVLGPDFFGYNQDISDGFKKNGWEVDCYNYLDGRTVSVGDILVNYIFKKNYLKDVNDIKLSNNYDLVLVIKGTRLNLETMQYIRSKSSRVYLWFMDPVNIYKEKLGLLSFYDKIFTFQFKDVETLRIISGRPVSYLPLFHNLSSFENLIFPKKDIDLIFIGNIYNGRAEYFDDILSDESYKALDVRIYGGFGFFKLFDYFRVKKKYPNLGRYLKFGLINRKKMHKLYSRSKASFNVHADTQNGLNMRFYELYGYRVFQFLKGNELETEDANVECCAYVSVSKNTCIDIKVVENTSHCFKYMDQHKVECRIFEIIKYYDEN